MTNAVQQLIDEREKLLMDIRTNDEEFLKLLRTMAKFHRYSYQDQLNLCRRAPEDCRALATKSAYAKYFNTEVTSSAVPVILQSGENTLKAVYDIEETVGFLRGDRELTQLPRRYSPAYEEDLLQFMGAKKGENLDEALHENLIIMTAGEEPLLTVSEYIVRSRLELPTDENAVLQMDREQVIQRLPDIHETAKSVLDLFKEEMDRYASRINSDTIRGNGISEDAYGRTLGIPAPGVSGEEPERGVADDDQKRGGQAVPQGLRGGNERPVYRHSGTTGSETGRNGGVQDEGRAGVRQKVQSSAADRSRDSDVGHQSVTIFSSIRKWYGETYPEDEIKNDIKDISFRKAFDLAKFNAGADEPFTLDGVTYRSDKDISEALTKAARSVYEAKEATEIDGSYHGLIFKITFNPLINKSEIIFAGNRHYFNSLYRSKPEENLAILHNLGQEIQNDIKEYQVKQTEYKEKLEKAKELLKKPYGKQDEIDSKERRLSEVDALIFNSDEKTEAEERGKRLDYIHSPKFPEKDRCAQMFMKLARAYLAVHSEWDDIKSNDYIAHCLLKKNFSREEIIKTLCTYSPTIMSEDDAKGYLPFEKKKPALSR